jgi:23S rRNA (uridine2552-2'-O)-methyltransferase
MKRSKTSKGWMMEHINDPWVQKAKADGLRSRAAYKLLEINEKDRLLKPGMVVVDLGAAPGSWCQVAARRIQPGGLLLALDLLPVEPLPGVTFLQGDFREDAVLADLEKLLDGRRVDLVLSDMAPNISGVSTSDDGRMMHLAELALDFSASHLRPGGSLLIKLFQGAGFMEYRQAMQKQFGTIHTRKPDASRDRSAEVYLLGQDHRPLS